MKDVVLLVRGWKPPRGSSQVPDAVKSVEDEGEWPILTWFLQNHKAREHHRVG